MENWPQGGVYRTQSLVPWIYCHTYSFIEDVGCCVPEGYTYTQMSNWCSPVLSVLHHDLGAIPPPAPADGDVPGLQGHKQVSQSM